MSFRPVIRDDVRAAFVNRQPAVQTAALVFGVIYLAAGVLGFLPFANAHGALFGLFRVNVIHNMVHAVIGIAGLAAAASVSNARAFCQSAAAILLMLGILGIFVANPFGLINIGGADIALHLASGAIVGYYGFLAPVIVRR